MRLGVVIGSCILALGAVAGVSCQSAPKEARAVSVPTDRSIPRILQGTIGSECTIRGTESQLISGFGIVVGLNGTGGGDLDVAIASTMERELARGGVVKGFGVEGGPLEGISPRQFLRDPNVAVVIVEAAVAPGSPKGSTIDVRVRTVPNSSVTSLEGGRLWTTELRLGPASVFGAAKTRILAEARGPIFINPFAEPGKSTDEGDGVPVSRTSGRVLAGGVVTEPLRLEIVLDDASHARSRSIVSAINSRFPQGPGDPDPIARGRDAGSISLAVPWEYRERGAEFLQLVRFLRIDNSMPEEWARAYIDALKQQPGLADELSWALQALGRPALPFISSMYDYPELAPRMAALRAGGRLGDQRAVPHLVELARIAPTAMRIDAITLLGDMPGNPVINLALRDLVNSPDLGIKVAAYEALSTRGDPSVSSIAIGDTFLIEQVPSTEPMVYVTQQGKPRIAIMGGEPESPGVEIFRPLLVRAWSDRLMLDAESSTSPLRLFYRSYRTGEVTRSEPPADLAKLVRYLARTPTPEDPEPGLGLTYSETVGALYEISRQKSLPAVFATEEDRLRAAVFDAANSTELVDRPEVSSGEQPTSVLVFKPESPKPLKADGKPAAKSSDVTESMVVPLTRPAKKK